MNLCRCLVHCKKIDPVAYSCGYEKILCNTTTIRLNNVTTLVLIPRYDHWHYEWKLETYIKVNLIVYRKVWTEENRVLIDRFGYEPRFRSVNMTRHLYLAGQYINMVLEVPIPIGLRYVDKPTYVRWVLAPAINEMFKLLNITSKKEIAKAIKSFVESIGYHETFPETTEHIVAYGGVCRDWAWLGYKLAKYFNLSSAAIGDMFHIALFLCEPWWRNSYGVKLYLRNGSVIECYIWIDTGAGIENWKKWRLTLVDWSSIPRDLIVKIEKVRG